MDDLQASLTSLVEALNGQKTAPIIIIIDELDRCRPTYAVKLLEEIKHLFDVRGIIFILGLYGEQLSRSIAGAYGPEFDGKAYLRRFINRSYRLRPPNLTALLDMLLTRANINRKLLIFPKMQGNNNAVLEEGVEITIARYMNSYALSARDAFQVVDNLQTCLALTKQSPLLMGYLLPLLISSRMRNGKGAEIVPFGSAEDWQFIIYEESFRTKPIKIDPFSFAQRLHNLFKLPDEIHRSVNNDPVAMWCLQTAPNLFSQAVVSRLVRPKNYDDLLASVGRFSVAQPSLAKLE